MTPVLPEVRGERIAKKNLLMLVDPAVAPRSPPHLSTRHHPVGDSLRLEDKRAIHVVSNTF
jgi:hypothetical protein